MNAKRKKVVIILNWQKKSFCQRFTFYNVYSPHFIWISSIICIEHWAYFIAYYYYHLLWSHPVCNNYHLDYMQYLAINLLSTILAYRTKKPKTRREEKLKKKNKLQGIKTFQHLYTWNRQQDAFNSNETQIKLQNFWNVTETFPIIKY